MFRIGQTTGKWEDIHAYLFVIEVNENTLSTNMQGYIPHSFDYDRIEGYQTDFTYKVG